MELLAAAGRGAPVRQGGGGGGVGAAEAPLFGFRVGVWGLGFGVWGLGMGLVLTLAVGCCDVEGLTAREGQLVAVEGTAAVYSSSAVPDEEAGGVKRWR